LSRSLIPRETNDKAQLVLVVAAPGEPVFSVPGTTSADILLVVPVRFNSVREDAEGMNIFIYFLFDSQWIFFDL
jgi:hypothetical protein